MSLRVKFALVDCKKPKKFLTYWESPGKVWCLGSQLNKQLPYAFQTLGLCADSGRDWSIQGWIATGGVVLHPSTLLRSIHSRVSVFVARLPIWREINSLMVDCLSHQFPWGHSTAIGLAGEVGGMDDFRLLLTGVIKSLNQSNFKHLVQLYILFSQILHI